MIGPGRLDADELPVGRPCAVPLARSGFSRHPGLRLLDCRVRVGLYVVLAVPAVGAIAVVWCRTIEEVIAAADAESRNDPPLSQATPDKVAAILAAAGHVHTSANVT